MTEYVRVDRAPDTTFKTCGFRGCTSFASHVLIAGNAELCFCCAQCAAVGVKEQRFAVALRSRMHWLSNALNNGMASKARRA